MNWHAGLRRLRLVGTVALATGVIFCASVFMTHSLGYAPDPSFVSLFTVLWPAGLALILLGCLLWVGAWVLLGFAPPAREAEIAPRRVRPDE
jgi:hypothetical protein